MAGFCFGVVERSYVRDERFWLSVVVALREMCNGWRILF